MLKWQRAEHPRKMAEAAVQQVWTMEHLPRRTGSFRLTAQMCSSHKIEISKPMTRAVYMVAFIIGIAVFGEVFQGIWKE